MAKGQGFAFGPMGTDAAPGFKAFARANQAALNAMTHIGVSSMRQMIEMNQQYLEFVRHRLDEDIKTGERISGCKDVPEVIEAVTDFYQRAFDEYSKEMTSLSEMAIKAASDTIEEAERTTKSAE